MRFFKALAFWLVCITGLQAQVSVVPTVKHLTSTGTPSAGAISLAVSGGTAPYSYTWTPGPISTKDITNKVKNTYVVKVKDSGTSTATYTYNIGYKAEWDQMYGCVSRNDSLISDASCIWSQAITKNNLAASTNGWVEYILKGMTETKVFGVLDSLSPLNNTYADIDYGYYYDGSTNSLYEIYYGGLINLTTGLTEGSVLRVERSGSTIKFVVNGVTTNTYTNASAAAKVWKVKAMLYDDAVGRSFVNMGCSFVTKGGVTFKNYANLIPFVNHSAGSGLNGGSIRVKPLKTGTYTYTWQPGSVASATISSKPAGQYTVSAKDATTTITPKNYNIGYKVKWDQMYRCSVRQDSLIGVDLGQDSWESAISKNTLPGGTNGWFEYVLRDMNQYKMIGFVDSLALNPNDNYDLDFGFYYELGTLYTYGTHGYFYPILYNINEGTVLRVERRGDTVAYKVNGAVVFSDIYANVGSKDWKVKGTLYAGMNSSMVNVGCSFYGEGNSNFPNYTRLMPTVVHASGPLTNDGSVKVAPKQNGTYTYTWAPGATSGSSITGKPVGTYSVKVKDALNHTNTNYYNIGYKVNWDQMNGCVLKHDTLINATTYNTWGRAISKNTLPGGQDGWVEYILKDLDQIRVFGFLDSLSPLIEDIYDIDYGFYYYAVDRHLYAFTNQIIPPALAVNLSEGTVLRIERIGNTINYKINGLIALSILDTIATKKNWKIKSNVPDYNRSSMINVGCSFYEQGYADFPNYHMLNPTIVHASTTGANDGSLKVEGIHSSGLTYNWTPGSVASNSYNNAVAGTYKVTSEDTLHHTNNSYYHVGYKTYWDSVYGATVSGDTLETTEMYPWGRGVSKNELPANTDGWFEFVFRDPNTFKIIGFLDSMSHDTQDIYDIDFGFNYDAVNHILYQFGYGAYTSLGAQPLEGTILRVERIADTIMYKWNGVVVHKIVDPVNARKAWRIKGIVHGWPDTRLVNVGCSFSYSAALSVVPRIKNYTDETTPGEINMNVSGGVPNYNVIWNGMAIADNHRYYLDLDTAFGGSVDSLSLYPKLDNLRKKQSLENIQSAIYNNLIIDRVGDTLHATTLVGTNFGWITSGVSTNTCVIPPDTASNFFVFYGGGQVLTKTDPGTTFKYAVSDCVISAARRECYTEFNTVNDLDEMIVGMKLANASNTDDASDMIQNTMIHFKGGSTHSMDIYYNNSIVYKGTYHAGEPISMLLDPLTNRIVYYRNFQPVFTQVEVPGSFYTANYQLKALLKTPLAQLNNVIVVGATFTKRQITGTASDVTCASSTSGSISFTAYSIISSEYLCGYSVSGPGSYSASGSLTPGGNVLTGLAAGTYTVSVSMRSGSCSGSMLSPMVQVFTVGYMPDWINQAPFGSTNVNITDRSFNTTASPAVWSGGASSDNMLDAGEEGWAEFKPLFSGITGTNRAMVFGLNNQDLATTPADNDHGFYVASNIPLVTIGLGGAGSSQAVGPYTATIFSLGNIMTINTISPTDVLKVKKVSLNSGLNMKLEFYKNNVFLTSNPTLLPATELVTDVSVSQHNCYINKPRISFGCDKRLPYYFVLKKVMDAGYYTSYRKSIYFTFEEEYYDPAQGTSNSLSYKIVTDKNVPIPSPPGLIEAIGDNRFTINLSTLSNMVQGNFYRIAITNKKNEVFYARFKY